MPQENPSAEDYKRDWSPWGITANPLNYRIFKQPMPFWGAVYLREESQKWAWITAATRRSDPTPWPKAGK